MKKRPVNILVSDHAILRWLQREHGIDVDLVRAHISGVVLTGAELGAISVRIGRVKFILRDTDEIAREIGTVVVTTALEKKHLPHV